MNVHCCANNTQGKGPPQISEPQRKKQQQARKTGTKPRHRSSSPRARKTRTNPRSRSSSPRARKTGTNPRSRSSSPRARSHSARTTAADVGIEIDDMVVDDGGRAGEEVR